MKKLYAFMVLLVGGTTLLNAQQPEPAPKQKPAKGYYAIGDHHQQLPDTRIVQEKIKHPPASKGYYSFGGHEKQLPAKTIFRTAPASAPAKGYYSLPRKK